jgi:MFS family permease
VPRGVLAWVVVTARLLDPQHRSLVVGVVGIVVAIAFEAIAVATAMPVAARELHGVRSYALAFSLFLTTSLVGMVLAGVVSDRRGPVLPFLGATVVFVAGLLLAGSAQDMWVLILARAVQGFGAGLNAVALYVVVGRAFSKSLRPRVFSALSGAWVLPALVGPPVAGLLADHASWRWVFFGVVPLTLGATALVLPRLRNLPAPEPASDPPAAERRGLLGAAVGAALGAGALQYAGQELLSLPAVVTAGLAVAGGLLLGVCVTRLLPRGSLRLGRGLPTIVLMRGVFSGAFFGAEAFIPLMLIEQRGLATTVAGASLTGGALTWSLGSWYQGRPGLTLPRPRLVAGGSALVALGILVVSAALVPAVPGPLTAVVAAVGWLVAGLGMGLGVTSLSVLLLEASPPAEQGANSAALQVSDSLGSILMLGLAGAVFAGLHDRGHDGLVFLGIYALTGVLAALGALVGHRATPT